MRARILGALLLAVPFAALGCGSSNNAHLTSAGGAGSAGASGGTSGSGGSGGSSGSAGTGGSGGAQTCAEAGWKPAAGAAQTGNQISQYGVTWTFDKSYTYGQFANGDYWVVGPVTITSMTPAMTTSGGRTMNGWDVNPMPSNPQGYDSCAGDYSASDVPSLPYTAKPGSSIVKAVSDPNPDLCTNTGGAGPQTLKTAAVLTVVDQPPPDNGATVFRPAYVGKKPLPMKYYSVSDTQCGLLPSLTPNRSVKTFEPKLTDIASRLGRVQLDHLNDRQLNVSAYIYNGVPNAEINPSEDMRNYGPDIDLDNNDAILRLMLSDPLGAKMPVLIAMLQGGIDRYGMLENGQFWPAGSGMYEGRKISIAFAAVMLGDAAMKKAVTAKNVLGMTNFFLEDATIGTGYQGEALYGSGLPGENACGDPYVTCDSPDFQYYWSWEAHTIGANDGSGDPYGYLDGSMNGTQQGDNYQPINSPAYEGSALIGILMPSVRAVWGHPEFFNYVDRWVSHGIQAEPDPCAPLSQGGGPDPNNPGGCVLDPDLTPGSTMQHFSCQAGKQCGRWPQYDGRLPNTGNGSYQSAFVNAMWAAFRNSTSASVYVAWSGIGQGAITSSPAGISCGAQCAASFPVGTTVTLTATPKSGSTFAGWSGACSGTGACTLTLKAVSSELPTGSVCPGYPAGVMCSSPATANAFVTGAFK